MMTWQPSYWRTCRGCLLMFPEKQSWSQSIKQCVENVNQAMPTTGSRIQNQNNSSQFAQRSAAPANDTKTTQSLTERLILRGLGTDTVAACIITSSNCVERLRHALSNNV